MPRLLVQLVQVPTNRIQILFCGVQTSTTIFLQALLISWMPHGQTSMTITSKVRPDGKIMILHGHQNLSQPEVQEKWSHPITSIACIREFEKSLLDFTHKRELEQLLLHLLSQMDQTECIKLFSSMQLAWLGFTTRLQQWREHIS